MDVCVKLNPNLATNTRRIMTQTLKLSSCVLLILISLFTAPHLFAETLVIAQLSDRPKKDFKQLRPMVEHVADALSDYGITGGRVELFSDIDNLIEAVKDGSVHWVTETPYAAARLVYEADATPLLIKWKSNQKRYQTYIYTRKESTINTLENLVGQRIAFEHQNSFSSYFVPRMIFADQQLPVSKAIQFDSELNADAINYMFSRNEKNNVLWVHKGLVNAGTLNSGDWENPKRVPSSLKEDLKIIFKSKPFPRAMELVSPKLSPTLQSALKATLLNLDPDKDAKLLKRYEKTSGFEEIDQQSLHFLKGVYSTYKQLDSQWNQP